MATALEVESAPGHGATFHFRLTLPILTGRALLEVVRPLSSVTILYAEDEPVTTAIHQWTPISEIQFCAWVAQAISGDRLDYHRGYLAVDADKVTSDLDPNVRAELACLRDRAFWSETAGLVHLVQQRLGQDCFAYLAIARPKTSRTARAVAQLAEAA